MTLSLGIDTGGTYTDAVLFDEDPERPNRGVIAKAKALTTRHDLTIGIAGAVGAVLAATDVSPADIALVSLSTTLATNALVEGRGGRVALVFIGFDDDATRRAGLTEALGGDPLIRIAGGHDPQGDQVVPLDVDALAREAAAVADGITGFAVTSRFAIRNPAHEVAARDVLARVTGLPVTCGHELSAKLDGPRRALTSVLNARLISLITGLTGAAREIVHRHGIEAPLMVVRGDGALMSAEMAMTRPIETILSGPAASLVGAAFLTGLDRAIVADIGGTTTDIAVVEHGAPQLDEQGATVGGFRTMVEAVAMTTIGLGGDSEVVVADSGVRSILRLGPRRLVPICLLALDHPDLVHGTLDRQLLGDRPSEFDARFVLSLADSGASDAGLDRPERELLDRIRLGSAPLAAVARTHADVVRIDRLVGRGLAMLAGFTPTDATHVLGDHAAFDRVAATKAATLMARKRSTIGRPVADGPESFSTSVVTALRRRSAEVVLDVALSIDGFDGGSGEGGGGLSRHPLIAASLDGHRGAVEIAATLTMPVVGLGASAPIHYPAVAALLRVEGVIPADADVANAIGAVVGRVRVHADVYIAQPERGRFRIHHAGAPGEAPTIEAALDVAEAIARAEATALAETAGASDSHVTVTTAVNIAHMEGEDFVVDATVTATASGRPSLRR